MIKNVTFMREFPTLVNGGILLQYYRHLRSYFLSFRVLDFNIFGDVCTGLVLKKGMNNYTKTVK